MAKKNKLSKVDHYFRIDMHQCYQWCLHNRIKIYPLASNTGSHFIEIEDNGMVRQSEQEYTRKEVYKKIWELYCYMYDKYSQQT